MTPKQAASPVTRALARTTLWPSWVAIAVVATVFSMGVSLPPRLRYLPLFGSIVLVGLPHGGVDHLAIPRTRGETPTARWFGWVGLLYLLLGGVYAALWFVAPAVSVLLFIAITWLHWGQGDVWPLRSVVGADHLASRAGRAGTVLVRGGIPMLVPLYWFPGRYRAVVDAIVGRFGISATALNALFDPTVRVLLVGGLATLSLLAIAVGFSRADDRSTWAVDAGETALLWWFFTAVPPVFAIGVYFTAWHSLRHVGRLIAIDPGGRDALVSGRPVVAFRRFARDAAPLTLLSLLFLVGLYLSVPNPPTDVPGLLALYLVFIAVLTLPHVVVVAIMDVEETERVPVVQRDA
jgi:Brp/Blh family beta-carotene 15,15'-monooxygenase